ncbi:MAG TPA: DnaJ domain-containing protein [Rudaea sp.]|nr:DnaJ domain-containing protein [Rudaea sp.]
MADALEMAMALYRAPRLGIRIQTRALPPDVLDVIRIASGDEVAADEGIAVTGLSRVDLREAAAVYLQQALFCEGADSYRTLGVNRDAPQRQVKEHHRWLIHWLHPDQDRGAELSVFAERVNRAWNDLRTADRRRAYDQFLEARSPLPAPAPPWSHLGFDDGRDALAFGGSRLSGRFVRRLPQIVLGSLSLMAALLVGGLLYVHYHNEGDAEHGEDVAAEGAQGPAHEAAETSTILTPIAPRAALPPTPKPEEAAPETLTAANTKAAENADVPKAEPPASVAAETAAPAESKITASVVRTTDNGLRPNVSAAVSVPVQEKPATPPAPPTVHATVATEHPETRSEPAPVARASAEPLAPTAAQAESTLARMQSAYGRGDLDELMALFAANPIGESRAALADQYRELFAHSRERSLVLHNVGWFVNRDVAVGLGQYETVIIAREGNPPRVAAGTIRVELKMEAGQARIVRMTHERTDNT